MTERPNRKALTDALDIYRDAMRPFIVRCLKRVRGGTVDDHIRAALRDDRYNQFEENLSKGREIDEAIDITDFYPLVKRYWNDVFAGVFERVKKPWDTLHRIAKARNDAAHPGHEDLEIENVSERLTDIAKVLTGINEPAKCREIEKIRSEIMPFMTSAHKFRQGGRDVYAFVLDLKTLDNQLPDRVDDKVVKDANRPLTESHAKNIQKYLETRDDWLLGTLLLGVSPNAVDFQSYLEEPNEVCSVGDFRIRTDALASMKMFDGQHRRRAIKDVLFELSHNRRYAEKLSALRESSLPVMVYVEDDIKALRQMFADAAQTRAIERNTVTRFDQRDAFNLAALWIAENSDLFADRVEMERSSVPRSSQKIIAINQLSMTLKTLEVGYKGRVRKERNDEFMLDLDSLYDRCWTWADDFMPTARSEYNDLMAGEIDNSDIPEKRTATMAYNATVIRILAGCYYEWTRDGADWMPLAEFLGGESLEPGVTKDSLLIDAGVVAPGGTSPEARQSLVLDAIEYIVQQAEIQTSR